MIPPELGLEDQLNTLGPDIIIQAGINDLKNTSFDTMNDLMEKIEKMVEGLKEKYPNSKVVLSCLIMRGNEEENLYTKMIRFNRFVRELRKGEYYIYVDHKKLHHNNAGFFRDMIHPNEEGTSVVVSDYHRLLLKPKNKEWKHVKGKQFAGKVFGGQNFKKRDNMNSDKIDSLYHMIKAIFAS